MNTRDTAKARAARLMKRYMQPVTERVVRRVVASAPNRDLGAGLGRALDDYVPKPPRWRRRPLVSGKGYRWAYDRLTIGAGAKELENPTPPDLDLAVRHDMSLLGVVGLVLGWWPRSAENYTRVATQWADDTGEHLNWRAMRGQLVRLRRDRAPRDPYLRYLVKILDRGVEPADKDGHAHHARAAIV